MKWIFALFVLISFDSFSIESTPAFSQSRLDPNYVGNCKYTNSSNNVIVNSNVTAAECISAGKTLSGYYVTPYVYDHFSSSEDAIYTQTGTVQLTVVYKNGTILRNYNMRFDTAGGTRITSYVCPPLSSPEYTVGPVDLNGSKVCQKPPKVCMMGAIVRVASDGKETCVSNCSAATGLIKTSQFYYQAGPDVGSTAGQVQCYGQCAVQTSGGYTQLSNGAYTGTFAFTGANCPVIRPEPTVDSESDTGGNGDAPAVDESTTSEGTDNALGELSGAASSATGSQVQPSATGPDGTSTLNDVAQTVADAANAQIQATSSQNVATGNLIANTTKDLQNTIIRTGSVGASSVLQAQGNSKLDGIGSAIGEGNGKLDGIKSTLDEISDKLDEPGEETPFVPGAGSGAFWESILPESSFTEIKDKQAQSIQDMKDLSSEFQDSISFTNLSASGAPDEWSLNVHGTALPFGLGAFQLLIDMGIAAIVLFLCALYTIYIITSRK